jgi:hypothetical protein
VIIRDEHGFLNGRKRSKTGLQRGIFRFTLLQVRLPVRSIPCN